jgi:hypothetical protein
MTRPEGWLFQVECWVAICSKAVRINERGGETNVKERDMRYS